MSDLDFREERDFSVSEPEFGPEMPPGVARECLEAWRQGKPWTRIRVLERGTDNPSDQPCSNSQGKFDQPCSKPVEAVQYTSAGAVPMFFCEEHALEQNDWDNILYWDPPPEPKHEMSEEDQILVQKMLNRGKRKREPEPEEFDL